MGVINRTLDASEAQFPLTFAQQLTISSGDTGVLTIVPYACNLKAAQIATFSVESNAYLMLTVSRFIVGSGATTYILGSTFTPSSFGTSGVATSGVSLPALGNTLMFLMPNDVLGYQAGGGSTAAIFGIAGAFVVNQIQDVTSFFGKLA